ncbi:helix-turn-helix transcriptional regulator [Sphingomonas sp. AP4-R1]|uniref:helix-turn-helix transcriptional regulator n=1 Tax=Sphingomonas sp. AP4-R1 TaxID=2735134 RepID=UPI001493BA7D|nr:helix-turn-helix transcriptional regulator [Sphingomonas sp. AP4-R1]QJU59037.1 helix-turn-helix transcriptional regulator [Sphingomonas sp. AP4-R1]
MDEAISPERLSHIIGLIYDCAIDPARWPIAMEAIRTELNFHNSSLDLLLLPSGRAISRVTTNIPPEYFPVIAENAAAVVERWGGEAVIQSLPLDEPAVLSWANPAFDPEDATNPYQVAFAKPQGIIDVMAIGVARDATAIGSLAFGRHHTAGPITDREVAVARLLVPHLQRAATINRMIEGAELARTALGSALDGLTVPVLLVDPQLRLIHGNPAGVSLLDQGGLVRLTDGHVQTRSAGATSALAAAVSQAARDEGALGRRGLGIPLRSQDSDAGALYVLPLARRPGSSGHGAVAAIFFAQLGSPFIAPTEMAAALFDLTATEAKVFALLVSGHTQTTAAASLGIERSTVKTHLSRLYDKIGVRRQTDLMQVAASLAVPLTGN